LLWFGLFRARREFDSASLQALIVSSARGGAYAGPLRFQETRALYGEKFARVQDYIRAGDAYQVNLTSPARFAFAGDPLGLYARLRPSARAGHGGYIDDGERAILSFSPESFFRITDGSILARPMKGTAPRGADPDKDEQFRASLALSEKERAENLMIVDLIRNDLGRVAETGSVRVDDLFAIETYPTVHQMVSTVRADLRGDASPSDLIRALFPCGSVTGTPKIRAQEIIRELEQAPRGLYCGAIGYFAPGGVAEFNVAIRTITIAGNEGRLGVGGAIVADSRERAEYDECLVKARYYTAGRAPIGLIETLRHDAELGFIRGDLHLSRLERSASQLGLPFSRIAVERAMRAVVKGHAGATRVRIHLQEDGSIDVRGEPFVETPPTGWAYAISPRRMQSADLLARHKIDWRQLFDEEFRRLNAETGCDQVIFRNERGELVEANGSTIFLRRNGRLETPPLSSGALDGCLRRALIEGGEAIETALFPRDLERAEVFLGNSLRGLVRAKPVATAPVNEMG